jgi:hypothetical protein
LQIIHFNGQDQNIDVANEDVRGDEQDKNQKEDPSFAKMFDDQTMTNEEDVTGNEGGAEKIVEKRKIPDDDLTSTSNDDASKAKSQKIDEESTPNAAAMSPMQQHENCQRIIDSVLKDSTKTQD